MAMKAEPDILPVTVRRKRCTLSRRQSAGKTSRVNGPLPDAPWM